jgi:hypothetical protein
MIIRRILLLATVGTIAGCVTGYTLVQPGLNTAQELQINADSGWNLAPAMMTPAARKGTQTWTRDGLLLDRLVLIPAVPDGETLLIDRSKTAALPVFRKKMLPNEIEELIESTLVKYFGEGNASVSTSNLRPQMFGERRGVMFDISAQLTDSPDYRGTIGAFVADDKLYMIWYIAAHPHYHDKHGQRAEEIIKSATLISI